MQSSCKFCETMFISLIIDRELAFKQISEKMLEHAKRKHKEEVEQLARQIAMTQVALGQYMAFSKFGKFNTDEESSRWAYTEKVQKCLDIVMAAIGFEPTEQEGEEKAQEEAVGPQNPDPQDGPQEPLEGPSTKGSLYILPSMRGPFPGAD